MAFPTASTTPDPTPPVTTAPVTAAPINYEVIAAAPAIAMGNFYIATSQSLATQAHNATTAQQHSYAAAQAATTLSVLALYSTIFGTPKLPAGLIAGLDTVTPGE